MYGACNLRSPIETEELERFFLTLEPWVFDSLFTLGNSFSFVYCATGFLRQKRYGLLAICEGGGTANATIASWQSETIFNA